MCGGAFKDRCRCDLNITPKNKTGGYKQKNGAVKIEGAVKNLAVYMCVSCRRKESMVEEIT